jgi:predicted nucleic acid-binding protein
VSFLLDTSIVIDLLRRNPSADKAVRTMNELPYVCAVTTMELFAGARSQREERDIAGLLGIFRQATIDDTVFSTAGSLLRHYRGSHGVDFADALIAATAEHHGLKLATLNVKHYPMFRGLKAAY